MGKTQENTPTETIRIKKTYEKPELRKFGGVTELML